MDFKKYIVGLHSNIGGILTAKYPAMISQTYHLDLFQHALFLFCGRRKDRIKAILWEGDGFLLLYKRLENGSFQWPRTTDEAREITSHQYRWLIEGLSIDQKKVIQEVHYKNVL